MTKQKGALPGCMPANEPGRGWWILLVILAGSMALSAPGQAGEGTVSNEFLDLVAGGRSTALGETYQVLGNDAESLCSNPAGILYLLNPQIGISHLIWWQDVSLDAVWGVQPLGAAGSMGLSAAYWHVPDFNSTEDAWAARASAWGMTAAAAYAFKPWRPLSLGSQLRMLVSELGGDRSWGLALDVGAQCFLSNDQWVLAVSLQNIGFATPYRDAGDPLPLRAGAGAAYHLGQDEALRLSLAAQISQPLRGNGVLSLGAETWFWNLFALRASARTGSEAESPITLGAGFRWQNWHLDYAAAPLGLLGPVHRISAAYDFGSQRRLPMPKLAVELITKQFVREDGQRGYEIQFVPRAQAASGVQRWRLEIQDSQNKGIRSFAGTEALPMAVVWDGLNDRGDKQNAEAYYRFRFIVVDRLGYTAEANGEILPLSITRLPRLKAMARDIFAGQVTFNPHVKGEIKEWSINIISADGRILKKYEGTGMIPKDFAWDGADEQNNPVAIGEGFRFVLRVKDRGGNTVESVAPLIVVDAGTKGMTESGIPLRDRVSILFKADQGSSIKNWIFDIIDDHDSQVVRSYEGAGPLPERIVWDSKDDQGQLVSTNRTYTTLLRLQDQIGNVWRQAAPLRSTLIRVLSEASDKVEVKIEQILFDFNKAELKPEMLDKIKKIADLMNMYPLDQIRVLIQGHTDEIGSDEYNQELSLNRARMVMRYLVEEEGVPSACIAINGFGKTQLLFHGESVSARARNRRVEVVLELPR